MSYFKSHYENLRFPIAEGDRPGLRRAQLGAIHGLASHYTNRLEPAIITMPTGSGKTAVLMMAAYAKRARRVLVVTPSAIVRSQIAQEFQSLALLKRLGAINEAVPPPVVTEVKHRCSTERAWIDLVGADAVIATPFTVSPGHAQVSPPPDWMFDLVLVDEAHHEPATTWRTLLDAFPGAAKTLFTATPYREDGKEIRGKFVFVYSMKDAVADGIFGQVRFVPVTSKAGESNDEAIARRAEQVLREDRASGFNHCLMVRTDQKSRAQELAKVYSEHTALRLGVIHSAHSYKKAEEAIVKLTNGELDGVICVDMFGEGFDFPTLKIAAVHVPHKSLSVTLQFIGRFTRVSAGTNIGEAKFVAVPSEIQGETAKLWVEDSIWQDLIVDLSQNRISREERIREALSEFNPPMTPSPEGEDVSLYGLAPAAHAKVYRTCSSIDLESPLNLPKTFELIYRQTNPQLSTTVFITKETQRPRWSTSGRFARAEYDLNVVYHDIDTNLLFISCSRRNVTMYEAVASAFTGGVHGILPPNEIDRVLSGLSNADFYNIGMRNRIHSPLRESYRILAGPSTQNCISRTDGRLFHRGHLMCRAMQGDQEVTLGYSSGSKVWSHEQLQIPELVAWFKILALRIAHGKVSTTGSNIDFLTTGHSVKELPSPILAVEWPTKLYQDDYFIGSDGSADRHHVLDVDLRAVSPGSPGQSEIHILVEAPTSSFELTMSIGATPIFSLGAGTLRDPLIFNGQDEVRMVDFFNHFHPTLFLADGSILEGNHHLPISDLPAFDRNQVTTWTWSTGEMTCEYVEGEEVTYLQSNASVSTTGAAAAAAFCIESVQRRICNTLLDSPKLAVVFYDHGQREVGDFLTIEADSDRVEVNIFHCKRSAKATPGSRVDDAYDVCGQAVKSLRLTTPISSLYDHLKRRDGQHRSRFLRGDLLIAESMLSSARPPIVRIVVVQPGFSAKGLTDELERILASTSDSVRAYGAYFELICSE